MFCTPLSLTGTFFTASSFDGFGICIVLRCRLISLSSLCYFCHVTDGILYCCQVLAVVLADCQILKNGIVWRSDLIWNSSDTLRLSLGNIPCCVAIVLHSFCNWTLFAVFLKYVRCFASRSYWPARFSACPLCPLLESYWVCLWVSSLDLAGLGFTNEVAILVANVVFWSLFSDLYSTISRFFF